MFHNLRCQQRTVEEFVTSKRSRSVIRIPLRTIFSDQFAHGFLSLLFHVERRGSLHVMTLALCQVAEEDHEFTLQFGPSRAPAPVRAGGSRRWLAGRRGR